ncbi:MAG: hypothetical protein ACK47B_12135 [Armatimonadota bacterium]
MANVLTVVWFVIGFVVTHTAILVWANLMLPNPVERARERVERRPYLCGFVGLGIFALFFTLAVALLSSQVGGLQLLGWIVLSPMLVSAVIGGAGIARQLAARIRRTTGQERSIAALVGGALCTALPGWLPVVGWFIYFPVTAAISIGAGAMAIARRQPRTAPAAQPAPAAEATHPARPAYGEAQPQFLVGE